MQSDSALHAVRQCTACSQTVHYTQSDSALHAVRQCTVHSQTVHYMQSDSALYAELKLWLILKGGKKKHFCRTWYESFSQNYYLKPNPVPLQFHDLISNQKALGLFPSTHIQNNLEWIVFWRNRLPPSSECLLKMKTVIYSEALLPRSHVILTYTTLFIHHCKKTKQTTQWMVHAGKTELQVPHYVLNQKCMMYVAVLWTPSELQFLLPRQINKKVKGYNKTKSRKPFWNAKCHEFCTYRWIYCQHNYPRCMPLPKQKWKNITTTFTTEHDKL